MSRIFCVILLPLFSQILCAECTGKHESSETTIIAYDENELQLKQYCEKNENLKGALQSMMEKWIAKGYEEADKKNFMNYFGCAVLNSKTDLEMYTAGVSKGLYYNQPEPKLPQNEKWIPDDIENIIKEYDAWMPFYDSLPVSNGHSPLIDPPIAFSQQSQLDTLLNGFTRVTKNWYLIISCPHGSACPGYVLDIQKYFKDFQQRHPDKYKSVDEMYRKFAVHMARSFKMMCVINHKVLRFMGKVLQADEKSIDTQFSNLLLKFVPTFYITEEQFFFLKALRLGVAPKIPPLYYYSIKNKHPKSARWTIIPYDNSTRCIQENFNSLSTTEISILS